MFRFGILGAAKIAPGALIEPAEKFADVEVAAVAASSLEKAQKFASQYAIPKYYDRYQDLIDDPDIDVIYNALSPNGHKDWTIAALQSGKHVLCEKPFAMDALEAQEMVDCAEANNRLLVEAFHYRFHPLFIRVMDMLQANRIGKLHHVAAKFDVYIPYHPDSLRHDARLGGGALMDLGCYPVHWIRQISSVEPTVISASAEIETPDIDLSMQAKFTLPNDVTASISCSMAEQKIKDHVSELRLIGENGALQINNLIAPHTGNKLIVESEHGMHSEKVPGETTYFYQLQHFIEVLKGNTKPLTGGVDAVNTMKLIDDIYKMAGMRTRAETAKD